MDSLILGDNILELKKINSNSINLIYIDPPFFTQKEHKLKNKTNDKEYSFDDTWDSLQDYLNFIKEILIQSHRILTIDGSIFFHCDKIASHHIRILLDEIFGINNFRSEIIWSYKRWSNSKKGLLNSHQNIYFYSKSDKFKFNTIFTDYSPSTNVDQILQARVRNDNGKSEYMRDEDGNIILGKEKKGVPLSDVWNIPFLNPKAKERVGYPTQKPLLLLNQILSISTDENDIVLDPCCGSGTTCVSAKLLNRRFIGIDKSQDAIDLTQERLKNIVISKSELLEKGENSYISKSNYELNILNLIDAVPVQRNSGIDGFLKTYFNNKPVPVKIQSKNQTLQDAKLKLLESSKNNKYDLKILIKTNNLEEQFMFEYMENNDNNLIILNSLDLEVNNIVNFKEVENIT